MQSMRTWINLSITAKPTLISLWVTSMLKLARPYKKGLVLVHLVLVHEIAAEIPLSILQRGITWKLWTVRSSKRHPVGAGLGSPPMEPLRWLHSYRLTSHFHRCHCHQQIQYGKWPSLGSCLHDHQHKAREGKNDKETKKAKCSSPLSQGNRVSKS